MVNTLIQFRFKQLLRPFKFKHLVLLLFLGSISFHGYVFSQKDSKKDSKEELLQKIAKHKKQDTVLFKLYQDYSRATMGKEHEKSVEYARKALQLSRHLKDAKRSGKAYYQLGSAYSKVSELDSAYSCFTKAYQSFESVQFKKGYSDCHNSLGIVHYMRGDFDQSLAAFKKCVENEKKYNHLDHTEALGNIGSIHGQRGEFDKAILYFTKVLHIKVRNGDKDINVAYNNLGVVYDTKGDWTKALEYYQKANRIEKREGYSHEIMVSYMNIGRVYYNQKEYEKALDHYIKAKESAIKNNDKNNQMRALTHEGIVYSRFEQYDKAARTQQEAVQLAREIGAKHALSMALNNLGDVYQHLDSINQAFSCYSEALELKTEIGESVGKIKCYIGLAEVCITQKDWNCALDNALKGQELANRYKTLVSKLDLTKILSEIYEGKSSYKLALFHSREHLRFKDSLYNEESTKKIAQLEYEHMYADSLASATERELILSNRVKQAKLDSARSEQFILWLIVGILSLILVAVTIISFLRFRNTRTKLKNIEVEQRLLRTQMTPHFLFNSISIVQGMILNGVYEKSLDYLSDFSRLLRLTLENSRNKTVSLEKELEAITSYVALQNKTSKEPYNCNIHLDSSTDPKKIALPPMLIQPFIENAIEHGFTDEIVDKQIDITIQFDEEDLVCVITDNGIGIDQTLSNQNSTKKSMATQITKDRLKLLASEFKVRTNFSIKDRSTVSEKGTVVTLVLPYKREENA